MRSVIKIVAMKTMFDGSHDGHSVTDDLEVTAPQTILNEEGMR